MPIEDFREIGIIGNKDYVNSIVLEVMRRVTRCEDFELHVYKLTGELNDSLPVGRAYKRPFHLFHTDHSRIPRFQPLPIIQQEIDQSTFSQSSGEKRSALKEKMSQRMGLLF